MIPAEIRGYGIAAKMKSGTSWTKSLDRTMLGSLRDRAVQGASRGEEKRCIRLPRGCGFLLG